MKDNLFEILLNLFEKTLTQLKDAPVDVGKNASSQEQSMDSETALAVDTGLAVIRSAHPDAMRIFTYAEQMKLTKASYQFLMRMMSWGIISHDVLELVLNQLIFSESRFVTLQETKWIIRNTLATMLNPEQLAFLDLVLYHKEDQLSLH